MKRDVIPILRAKHICVHSFLVFVIVAITGMWLDYSFVCRLSMCSVAAESMPGTEPRSITYSCISA